MPHFASRASVLATSALILLGLAFPATVTALDTFFVGPRAMGMAGANVASTSDTSAQYYNPAAFGFFGLTNTVTNDKGKPETVRHKADNNNLGRKDWGWDVLSVGAGLSVHENLPELIDDIADIDIDELQKGVGTDANKLSELVRLANKFSILDEPGNGLRASVSGGTALRIMNFGLGVRTYGQGAARVSHVDTTNLGLDVNTTTLNNEIRAIAGKEGYNATPGTESFFTSDQIKILTDAGYAPDVIATLDDLARREGISQSEIAPFVDTLGDIVKNSGTGGGDLRDNTTAVEVTALGLTEVPFTYGYAFNEHFALGGNVKVMVGQVYATEILVFESESGDIIDNMTEEYEQTVNFGIDFGAMYRFNMFQLGFVGRNLNSPKFDGPTVMVDGKPKTFSSVTVKPQFQAGVAFIPFETLTFELDYDLSKNRTQLTGYDTQYLRFGAEWDILRTLALRAGCYKNMAEDDIGLVYTAGLGLNLWAVRFDLAGAFSSKTATFDGQDYPREVQVVAGLSIDF